MSSREAYPHLLPIPTRWMDNDVYGHVNNVQYYSYFDTVINNWLIAEGGLDIHAGQTIGMDFDTVINNWLIAEGGLDIHAGQTIGVCVESHCAYHAGIAFPETIEAGLRVGKLGRSSVRYEIGLFRAGVDDPAATGWFVHVFVDRERRRPAEIPPSIRAALERLVPRETPA